MPHKEIYEMGDLQGADPEKMTQQNLVRVASLWFCYFVAFDPTEYLRKRQCLLLAINGTLGMQVSAEPNLAAIKADLQKGGKKKLRQFL